MARLCRLCGERPVTPSRIKAYDYRCSRCRYQTPASRKHYHSERYKRAATARLKRRIYVGREYHSMARSAEHATLINAHIRTRRHAFVAGLQDREKTEGVTPGGVPPEAAV